MGKIQDTFMAQDEHLLKILRAASKKAITRKGLQANHPAKDYWTADVNEINYIYLTFILKEKFNIFGKHA